MNDGLKEAMVDHGKLKDEAASPMDTSTFGAGIYGPPGHRCRSKGEYHATPISAVDESEDAAAV